MSTHISELQQDPRNARKHNARNLDMIERSLQEVGAGRSIVIDENNVILAGNGTIEAAGNAGIEKIRVIETDGHEIIAVRRIGLTEEQKTKLSLYDNRTAELASWETGIVAVLNEDFDLAGIWSEKEMEILLLKQTDVDMESFFSEAEKEQAEDKEKHTIKLEYNKETYDAVKKALAKVASTPEQAVCHLLGVV